MLLILKMDWPVGKMQDISLNKFLIKLYISQYFPTSMAIQKVFRNEEVYMCEKCSHT